MANETPTAETISAVKGMTPDALLTVQKVIGSSLAAALDTEIRPPSIVPDTIESEETRSLADSEYENTPSSEGESELKLPEHLRRSLKAFEWTDEEIADGLATYGEKFVGQAEKLYKTRKLEIEREADFGRRVKKEKGSQVPVTGLKPVPVEPTASSTTSVVSPAYVAELKKKYGDDPLLDAVLEPYRQLEEKVNKFLPRFEETEKRIKAQDAADFNRRVDKFFDEPAFEAYRQHYGLAKGGKVPKDQFDNRYRIVEFADDLIRGRMERGQPIDLEEALQLAHDALGGELKTQSIKQQTIDELKKRGNAVSLRPSARPVAPDNTPRSLKELARHVSPKLKEALGRK